MVKIEVICQYCDDPAELVSGKVIYPHRADLWSMSFWRCVPCGAYVGCHGESKRPLGRLANLKLRIAKKQAHAAFDPLWKERGMSRHRAYQWLSDKLGIESSECHIGMFDVETCEKVIMFSTRVAGVPDVKGFSELQPEGGVKIYTDGSCWPNPGGSSGWAFVVAQGGRKVAHATGSESDSTSNRAELLAALEALRWAKEHLSGQPLLVITDSKYISDGVSEWLVGWKKKGWRTGQGKPVKNKDLWLLIDALLLEVSVDFRWVRGHSGNPGNEMADVLAGQAAMRHDIKRRDHL